MSFRQATTKRFSNKTPTITWPSFDTLSGSYLVGIIATSASPAVNLTTPPPAPWTLVKDIDSGSLRIRAYAIENAEVQLVSTLFAPVFDVGPNGILALVEIDDAWTGGGALEASQSSQGSGSLIHSGTVTTLTAHDQLLAILGARNMDVQSPTAVSQLVTGVGGDGNPNPNVASTANANRISLGLYTATGDAVGTYDLTAVLGDGTPSRAWAGIVLALKDTSGGRSSLGRAIADTHSDAVATQLVVNGPRSNALRHTEVAGYWPSSMSGDTEQPPSVTMLPVDGISQSGGLVHALADVKGLDGELVFDYGHVLDTSGEPVFDTSLTAVPVTAAFGDQPVDSALAGLLPLTTFYVRARVTTERGETTSPIVSFTTLDVTGPPPSGPPTIDVGPRIAGQTQTTITFTADISMHGAAGTVFGEQLVSDAGTGPAGMVWASVGPSQPLPDTADHATITFIATGLAPSTSYVFRIRATNPNGSDGDALLTTGTTTAAPVLPVPTALPAQAVTSNSATLVGQVDHVTNQSGVDVVLEIGLDTTYGTQLPVHHLTSAAADSTQTVNDSVISLTPLTTYHYRVRSARLDGVGGTILSSDRSFTTLAPPVVTIPVPAMAAASGIGSATSVLNATVGQLTAENPVVVTLEWGLTTGYGSSSAPQTLTFATPTTNAVVISGTCDPQGFVTQLAVEYGTDPDTLSSVLAAGQLIGTGPQAYRIILPGLAKNTRYWYRVRGASSAGTGYDSATPRFVDTGP